MLGSVRSRLRVRRRAARLKNTVQSGSRAAPCASVTAWGPAEACLLFPALMQPGGCRTLIARIRSVPAVIQQIHVDTPNGTVRSLRVALEAAEPLMGLR